MRTYIKTFEITYSIAASLAANSIVAGTFVDLTNGRQNSELDVPTTQQWQVVDIYTRGSSDVNVDAVANFTRNGVTNVLTTDPLSSLTVSNPSRPRYPNIILPPGAKLSSTITTLAANGTSATQDNLFIKVQINDYSS
ncbi:hypothetical protein [Metallosphaera sp.]|uniref:hypothetical protein n=1 Tax=Metallosphaera sp. TaxID=2020860 RepID=UPI0031659B12